MRQLARPGAAVGIRIAAFTRPEVRVDEYLSDNEQVERLRTWWRENGWFVIGGAAPGSAPARRIDHERAPYVPRPSDALVCQAGPLSGRAELGRRP